MTEKLTLATKSKFEQGGFTHHWHILNAMLVEPWPAVLYDDKLSQLLPYPWPILRNLKIKYTGGPVALILRTRVAVVSWSVHCQITLWGV